MIGISKAGYYHVPLLNFSFGKNGFAICVMGQNLTVSW